MEFIKNFMWSTSPGYKIVSNDDGFVLSFKDKKHAKTRRYHVIKHHIQNIMWNKYGIYL